MAQPSVPVHAADQFDIDQSVSRRRALRFATAAGLGAVAAQTAMPRESAVADSYADLTLSNLTSYPTARSNLGVALTRTPEQYGAVGDGTTDDSSAIQSGIDDLHSNGGGTLWFTAPTYLIGSTVTLKDGVTLATGTMFRSLLANTGTSTLQAASGLTGWLFDTLDNATPKIGLGIVGFNIVGPGDALSSQVGGIRLHHALNARLQWLAINKFSDSCISTDQACTSLAIEDCVIQTDSTGRTLTAPCGSLDLGGTDHYIRSIQCNGGPSDTSGTDGNEKITYPGDFYRTGAHIHCITSWIFDLNGEFGDVGIYIDSTAGNNRFIGTRADVNAGHGFYLDGASYNQFVGCYAIGNGLATGEIDTFDGAIHVNDAKQNKWTNFLCYPLGTVSMRYGWNDATTGNKQSEQNTVDFPVGLAGWVTRDLHNSADPIRYSLQPSGSGTAYERPPSRYMAGASWWDTTSEGPTFSDGQHWKDADNNVVGNLMSPDQAIGRTTLKWAQVDSKGTVAGLYTALAPAAVKTAFADLAKITAATSTSAAVPGGAFQIQGTTKFPVAPGQSYTLGCRTIAGSEPATVGIGVNWFNAGGSYLSTDYAGGGSANNTTDLTAAVGAGLTAPLNATQAQILVVFDRDGMAADESHYLSYAFAVHGSASDYVEP